MILAIETATDVCSVAYQDENEIIHEKRVESRGSHSEKLFLFIQELMKEHQFAIDDLSAILVSEGPGSYTGLRIAASGVKGLLFGSDIPLYSISTMASFACSAIRDQQEETSVHAIIDARRVHVYHQQFRFAKGRIKANDDIEVIPIESFQEMVGQGDIIIGTGIDRLDSSAIEKARTFGKDSITACSLIELYHRSEGEAFMQRVAPEQFDPKYYTSNQIN